jgi:hypothetical protein
MSSIRKELLIVSSIIQMSWHGSRNWDFDLIQLEGEQYVLAGVCWRLQEWILKVDLESHKTAIKLHRSAQQNKTKKCNGTHYELCQSQEWRQLMVNLVVETSGSQECVGGTCKSLQFSSKLGLIWIPEDDQAHFVRDKIYRTCQSMRTNLWEYSDRYDWMRTDPTNE